MASFQSNIESDALPESHQKKRRKIGANHQNSLDQIPWRSQTEQQTYSSKLLDALRDVLRRNSSPVTKPCNGRQVRETANRVLAVAAKGRTRWSRAILVNSLNQWKLQRHHKKVKKAAKGVKKPAVMKERRKLPAVQKKVRVLGQLVPGCRKVSFPNLLEETTDYISALEMQVRALTAFTEVLTGGAPADRLEWTRP